MVAGLNSTDTWSYDTITLSVSVYKIVTASRKYHVFKTVNIYSFLLSESNKTYSTCHSSRCEANVFGLDIIPVSSLFADVAILSWSSVIVNTFVVSSQKLCKTETFRQVCDKASLQAN